MSVNDWQATDIDYMRVALDEARLAATEGEVPVGAIVVADDNIVGRGRNASIRSFDPSGHAEILALRAASLAAENCRLNGATLYVTLEPCAMCVGAIVQARVDRVVFAAYDTKAGALGSAIDLTETKALNHRFEVNGGLLADEARDILQAFFRQRR